MKVLEEVNLTSWRSVERIRLTLHLDSSEMSEMLRLTKKEYLEARLAFSPLSIDSISALTEQLNLSWDKFFRGTIDWSLLASQYMGDAEALPERYTVGARSRMRTVSNFSTLSNALMVPPGGFRC